jgi:outer membrane autotransporter protein
LGFHDTEARCAFAIPGFAGPVSGDSSAFSIQSNGEIGYRVEAGSLAFEPFAGVSHFHLEGARIREAGSAAALVGATRDFSVTSSMVGSRATAGLPVGTGGLTLNGTLAWRHAFDETRPGADLRFATGSLPSLIRGMPAERDALLMETGLEYAVNPNTSLMLRYEGEVGSRAHEHGIRGGLSARF